MKPIGPMQFYPAHIEKGDKHFFYPCMDYFTKAALISGGEFTVQRIEVI